MDPIRYINRLSGQEEIEKVYGENALRFLYGDDFLSRFFSWPILHLLARTSLFSALYGYWQKLPSSRKKIAPFIEQFQVDSSEFLDDLNSFSSFNDFFIRKLKPETRPIHPNSDTAIIPADGRYLFYQDLFTASGFVVKNRKFDLATLLESPQLALKYAQGSMVIARLCPMDYHRFHFPCDCVPGPSKLINGFLYSVNPVAVKKNLDIFTQNKRTLCELKTQEFGTVLFLEIGATSVGSIHQTYQPDTFQSKGAEKGYFSFGGSSLILLFEPQRILFDADLVAATAQGKEIKCLMGQSMGKAIVKKIRIIK